MKKTLAITLSICVLSLIGTDLAYAKGGKKNKSATTENAPAASGSAVLAHYDTDKDGQLSDSETDALKKDYEANKTEILKQYDTNNDGKLDDTEIATLKNGLTPAAPAKAGKHGNKKKKDAAH